MAPKPWQPASTDVVTHALEVAGSIRGAAAHLGVASETLRAWAQRAAFDLTPYRSTASMRARSWEPESRAAVDAAMAEATSITDLARRLGITKDTLRRWALRNDVDLTPVRAIGGPAPAPILEPAEQLERDTALSRVKAELDGTKRLYAEALAQIRTQEDIAIALAGQFATPLPAPKFAPLPRRNEKKPERELVLQVSDWQMGELVRPEDVGGVNEYSWPTMQRRLGRWVDAVVGSVRNQQQAYTVRRIVVAFLGDMVEGHDVYNGQAWHLDKDAAMQALDGATAWAAALAAVIEQLPGVEWHVYCVPGNHGKPGGRSGGASPATFSFDYLFYRLLEKDLANHQLAEFAIEPAGRLLFWSAGHVFLCIHGNEVRAWGGFPAYGLDKADARLAKELEHAFAYLLLGHFHQAAMMPSGRGARIINGSAVGANQLTQAAVLGATLPTQNMIWVSHEYGLAELGLIHLAPGEYTPPQIHGVPA